MSDSGARQRQVGRVEMTDLVHKMENKFKRKSVPGGRTKLLNIPRNWLHQGLLYMDRTEFRARVFVEVIGIFLFSLLFSFFFRTSVLDWRLVLFSTVVVHTLNWMLNGNWWACILFTFPHLENPGAKATCHYLTRMKGRLEKKRSIVGVMVYGSLSRGKWHNRSDLDVRVLRHPGIFNGIQAIFVMMRERIIAVFTRQPLDVYLADGIPFLEKMRNDEIPIFLVKRSEELEKLYPGIGVRELHVNDLNRRDVTNASS